MDLLEVGTYLLVWNYTGEAMCKGLKRWCSIIDLVEATADDLEQKRLKARPNPGPVLGTIWVRVLTISSEIPTVISV